MWALIPTYLSAGDLGMKRYANQVHIAQIWRMMERCNATPLISAIHASAHRRHEFAFATDVALDAPSFFVGRNRGCSALNRTFRLSADCGDEGQVQGRRWSPAASAAAGLEAPLPSGDSEREVARLV
jgi:hypothetical protein